MKYQIQEQIYESLHSHIHKGVREEDKKAVILKGSVSKELLQQAHFCYQSWGAEVKAKELESTFGPIPKKKAKPPEEI